MTKDNSFLGTAPIGKLLFKLAIPTIAAQLINMLYNVVDRIYIGHIDDDGSLALTGLGVCLPIIMIVSAFAALISSGGAPRASIFMGKGDNDSAEITLGSCFSAQLIVSIILTAVLLIWHRPLLLEFGASENTIGYASDYLAIYALGTVFVQLTLGMNAFITAQGFTRIGMFTVLIGAVLNIILDPVLIFGLDMGVKGAALATVISQAVSCVWVIIFLLGKKTVLKLRARNLGIKLRYLMPCIALGLAPFIMQASESVITVAFNSSLLKYGGDIAVGAMTIFASVMQLALMPLQGLAQGAQPIAGYNLGARNSERIKRVFKILLISSLAYSLTVWVAVTVFPTAFASIFTSDAELIDFASRYLRIYCGALGIFGAQIACQMTFVSLGKALSSVVVAVMRKFVLLLPLIYIIPAMFQNKTLGVFTAEVVADVISVIFTVILFSFQFRKVIKSIE